MERLAGLFEQLAATSQMLTEKLATVGEGAFSALLAGAERADAAMTASIEQANAVAAAWDRAAVAAARYGDAAGASAAEGGGGRRSGGSRVPSPEDQLRADQRNAVNRDEDYITQGQWANPQTSRTEPGRMNSERDDPAGGGLYGPPPRPYSGEDDEYANTRPDNRNFDQRAKAESAEAARAAEGGIGGFLGSHGGGILKGMKPVFGGLAVFGAEKSAMDEDLAIRQALMGMNITDQNPEFQKDYDRLRTVAYSATKGTKFSEAQGAVPMREALPVLAMQGEEGMKAAEATYPIALRLGELSELRHKGSIGSEAVAAEDFAHLEQHFDPTPLEKSLNLINAIAMRTDTSILGQQGIMKYGLPTALAAGIDPDEAAAEIGGAELRLGQTTTAGTGYSRFLLGALHSGGGINAQLPRHLQDEAKKAQREFEQGLKLEPDEKASHDVRSARERPHDIALHALGITSKTGKLLDQTPEGHLDVARIKQQIFDYGHAHDNADTLNTLQDAFGQYGGRYASAYLEKGYINREKSQVAAFRDAPSVADEQTALSHSPLQQFEQMLANVANIGNTLATTTLGPLNVAFGAVNTNLIAFNAWLKEHSTVATVGGWSTLVGGSLMALGVLTATAKTLWNKSGASALAGAVGRWAGGAAKMLGLGGEEAAAGGAAAGAGLEVGAALPGIGTLAALAYGAKLTLDSGTDEVYDKMFGKGSAEQLHKGVASMSPFATRPAGTPAAAATPPAPNTITVTIHNTMNADPGMFDTLMAKLTAAVKGAMERVAADAAGGSNMSPYLAGMPP